MERPWGGPSPPPLRETAAGRARTPAGCSPSNPHPHRHHQDDRHGRNPDLAASYWPLRSSLGRGDLDEAAAILRGRPPSGNWCPDSRLPLKRSSRSSAVTSSPSPSAPPLTVSGGTACPAGSSCSCTLSPPGDHSDGPRG